MPHDHTLAMHRTTATWLIGDAKDTLRGRRRKSARHAKRQYARALRRHNKALAHQE